MPHHLGFDCIGATEVETEFFIPQSPIFQQAGGGLLPSLKEKISNKK